MPPARAGRSPIRTATQSYRHYLAPHRHLFQDVYSWAGRIRTVRIFKQDSAFCYPEHVDREMRRLFAGLAKQSYLRRLEARPFAGKAGHLLAELNAVHPFREGNGRTQPRRIPDRLPSVRQRRGFWSLLCSI
jgi:cell filamentation protein